MQRPFHTLIALSCLASAAPVLAAPQDSGPAVVVEAHPYQAALDRLAAGVEKGQYNGVVALVEVGGERVLESAIGLRDVAAEAPMRADAIFRIYSMSKPVTAVAALVLVDAGELELDAPVEKYLPEFAGLEVGVERDGQLERVPVKRPMTVRDLCRHTAGLTYGIFASSMVDALVTRANVFDPRMTNAELVTKLSKLPLKSQPGARFEYSLASDVLGRVVEVAAEQPLDAFMRERIFEPLGMVDTGFHVPEDDLERVVTCYRRASGALVPTRPGEVLDATRAPAFHSGGGGLYSTASDYARFCRMLLGHGALGDVRILKAETADEMMTDQLDGVPAPMLMWTGGAFGLGLAVTTPRRRKGPHSGTVWWGGYAGTGFWVDREVDMVGVFMIQNVNEILHSNAFQGSVYEAIGR